MDAMQEIRESQIRSEEATKSILAHIQTILVDISNIKSCIAEHNEEIIKIQLESDFYKAEVKTLRDATKDSVDRLWEGIRECEKRQADMWKTHDANSPTTLDIAKKDVVKDVKLWIYGTIIGLIITIAAAAFSNWINSSRIDEVTSKVEKLRK